MEPSPRNRSGEIGEDVMIILVTVAQLIFLTRFHEHIAWRITASDGTVARLSMLTEDYFTWLPFPIAASILVVVASLVMMVWDNRWFRQAAWVGFCLIGIAVVVSLLVIFPFDFSVIPDPTVASVVPRVVTVFLILQATFYGIMAVVLFLKLRRLSVDPGEKA